jgi:hypothetical protein
MLGHSSVKVTERHYAAWTRERREKIEEAIRKTWVGEKVGKSGRRTADEQLSLHKPL